MLHARADLDRMAAKVKAGAAPYTAGFARLTANRHARSDWKPNPQATISRGPGGPQNYTILLEALRRIREATGDTPLLFNQIAGGKSPRLSLTDLSRVGVDMAIYSTPCLFAAHEAIDRALTDLKRDDGLLRDAGAPGTVGVRAATELLERNISRHHRGTP